MNIDGILTNIPNMFYVFVTPSPTYGVSGLPQVLLLFFVDVMPCLRRSFLVNMCKHVMYYLSKKTPNRRRT